MITEPSKILAEAANKFIGATTRCLDLGCGTGRDSLFLAKKGFQVLAVDKDEKSLAMLAKEKNKCGLLSLEIFQSDIALIKLRANFYNIINAINVLHLLNKPRALKVIKSIQKATKRGGIITIADFTVKDAGFKKAKAGGYFKSQELLRLFQGFAILFYQETEVLDSGHKGYLKPHKHAVVRLIAQKI